MRIGLFVACLTDTLFPGTARATVRVLERLGYEVVFPREQTCCGQAHHTSGYRREAAALAARFASVFARCDLVVTPSASCAAMVRTGYPRLAERERRAEEVPRVLELTEFLVDVAGVTDVGATFPHRVTYHPTCQSLRALKVGDRPLRLLRAVRGLELAELPAAEECCGFGGTFAWKNADTSVAIVADKVRHIGETGAEVVCAVDDACLTQISGAMSRLRGGVRTLHLAEILAADTGEVPR
ncbi:(Fe-S)-binding protein [Streptomonospora nanhaiensis]|uniref:L-lactate dehydrogenase complex protein LldE n=1 Tax=Streptomonospora nanhaiensis TaxID=1323731 RepID=A0A853BJ17_9ACTN|nr:(Fe-S)-binding protein [Streptomonospora nanhaiensis]MBV2363371.1 (Fe-S)-binding protein [Streptomonospora nanhaiensis]MBX9389291.1 (Fe-S)-binding protein [Streptomonospora nanhaiensis]NYI94572.1 L-lactate dehydrogenase complex protein LldE [Streptomonospora nanhaiensis]